MHKLRAAPSHSGEWGLLPAPQPPHLSNAFAAAEAPRSLSPALPLRCEPGGSCLSGSQPGSARRVRLQVQLGPARQIWLQPGPAHPRKYPPLAQRRARGQCPFRCVPLLLCAGAERRQRRIASRQEPAPASAPRRPGRAPANPRQRGGVREE